MMDVPTLDLKEHDEYLNEKLTLKQSQVPCMDKWKTISLMRKKNTNG